MSNSAQGGFVNGEFFTFARAGFTFGDANSKLIALTSVEYDDGIELEGIYGANMAPLGFGEGKYSANFKLTVAKEDFNTVISEKLGKVLYEHDPFDFTVSYAKRTDKVIKTDVIRGIRITKISNKSAEGDKSTMIDIEGMALGGIKRDGKEPVSGGPNTA